MYAKNTWEKYKDQLNEVFDYNEGYKHYISKNYFKEETDHVILWSVFFVPKIRR